MSRAISKAGLSVLVTALCVQVEGCTGHPAGHDADVQPDADHDASPDSEVDADADPEPDVDADPEADTETEADVEPEAEPDLDIEEEPWVDPPPAGRMGDPDVPLEEPVEPPPPRVVINEILAANDSINVDEAGGFDDWIEIYNASSEPVDLTGWALSDDERDGPKWYFPPDLVIEPHGYLLVWADAEPMQGPLHASFSLDAAHEEVILYAPPEEGGEEPRVADGIVFEDQLDDVVLGRFPNGAAYWAQSIRATPGLPNPADPGWSLDPSDVLFPQDRVIRIELWLPAASMDSLRRSPYTWVPASLGFEGVFFPLVGIRLKGFWGSRRAFDRKAAFKISLNLYTGGQRLRGLRALCLNNMVQDCSTVHERVSHRVYRESGIPAPRTAHVALYMNGVYRGLYLNVEPIKHEFLERWFDDPNGNLYDGDYRADVDPVGLWRMDLDEQGSEDVADRSDLIALSDFLNNPPSDDLVEELESMVEVDLFLRMTAIDAVTAHWDGYCYNTNNFRMYHNPSTGRFTFIPWGTDQTFSWTRGIYDCQGRVARWVLAVPSLRERYNIELWRAADRYRDPAIPVDIRFAEAMVTPFFEADTYRECAPEAMHARVNDTVSFLGRWPDSVVRTIFPGGEPGFSE
jgi:hypothetical protein